MKIKDLTVGQTVAVHFYGSKNSTKTIKYDGRYSFAATQATVIEADVHGEVYRSGSYRHSLSASANYVIVEREDGKRETIMNTKIVGDWETYRAEQIAVCDARMASEKTAANARVSVDAELVAIAAQLGISEYKMPTVDSGHTYNAATIALNKRKLLEVLKLALAASN